MSYINVNDIEINYEISGSGYTLVLIHGWGADRTVYDEQKEELSKNFELLLYDQRGHGESSKSPDKRKYNIDQFTDDLKGLLDSIGKKRVNLLGHSMGGNIALSFAIKYPEYVNKLILASTFAERRISFCEKIQLNIARLLPLSLIARPFAKSCLSVPDEKQVRRIIGFYENAGKETLLNSAKSIGSINYLENIHSVKAETLIMHGDEDNAVPFENAEKLHDGIENSKLVTIKGGGHSINWENKEEFNSLVIDFLE